MNAKIAKINSTRKFVGLQYFGAPKKNRAGGHSALGRDWTLTLMLTQTLMLTAVKQYVDIITLKLYYKVCINNTILCSARYLMGSLVPADIRLDVYPRNMVQFVFSRSTGFKLISSSSISGIGSCFLDSCNRTV